MAEGDQLHMRVADCTARHETEIFEEEYFLVETGGEEDFPLTDTHLDYAAHFRFGVVGHIG